MNEVEQLRAQLLREVACLFKALDAAHYEVMSEPKDLEQTLDDLISAVADAAKHGAV